LANSFANFDALFYENLQKTSNFFGNIFPTARSVAQTRSDAKDWRQISERPQHLGSPAMDENFESTLP
jgi:hypothetical protein